MLLLFTTRGCKESACARALLTHEDVPFTEVSVDSEEGLSALKERSPENCNVPLLFDGEHWVGRREEIASALASRSLSIYGGDEEGESNEGSPSVHNDESDTPSESTDTDTASCSKAGGVSFAAHAEETDGAGRTWSIGTEDGAGDGGGVADMTATATTQKHTGQSGAGRVTFTATEAEEAASGAGSERPEQRALPPKATEGFVLEDENEGNPNLIEMVCDALRNKADPTLPSRPRIINARAAERFEAPSFRGCELLEYVRTLGYCGGLDRESFCQDLVRFGVVVSEASVNEGFPAAHHRPTDCLVVPPFRTGHFFGDDTLYFVLGLIFPTAINMHRQFRGSPRHACEVAESLLQLVLDFQEMCVGQALARDPFAAVDMVDTSMQDSRSVLFCFRLRRAATELQRVDMMSLSATEHLAFFLNIYRVLHFHANLEKRDIAHDTERTEIFDKTHYVIGGRCFSLNDIEHGILRGNSRKPGRFMAQFSPDDTRAAITVQLTEYRPLALFALTFPRCSSPSSCIYDPETVVEALQLAASGYCDEEVGLKPERQKITLPGFFSTYSQDFGRDQGSLLQWLVTVLPTAPSVMRHRSRSKKRRTLSQKMTRTLRRATGPSLSLPMKDLLYRMRTGANVSVSYAAGDWDWFLRRYPASSSSGRAFGKNVNPVAQACKLRRRSLYLCDGRINRFPQDLSRLSHLQTLDLGNNAITDVPDGICNLRSLRKLILRDTQISSLPPSMARLTELRHLDISGTKAPLDVVCQITPLEYLNCARCGLAALSEDISSLRQLRSLVLSENRLKELPSSLSLIAVLELLDVSGNKLTTLPNLPRSLQHLSLHHNLIERVPAMIGNLNLVSLGLAHNKLTALPMEMRKLRRLEFLDVSRNAIRHVAYILASLTSLLYVRLDNEVPCDIPSEFRKTPDTLLKYLHTLAEIEETALATMTAAAASSASSPAAVHVGAPGQSPLRAISHDDASMAKGQRVGGGHVKRASSVECTLARFNRTKVDGINAVQVASKPQSSLAASASVSSDAVRERPCAGEGAHAARKVSEGRKETAGEAEAREAGAQAAGEREREAGMGGGGAERERDDGGVAKEASVQGEEVPPSEADRTDAKSESEAETGATSERAKEEHGGVSDEGDAKDALLSVPVGRDSDEEGVEGKLAATGSDSHDCDAIMFSLQGRLGDGGQEDPALAVPHVAPEDFAEGGEGVRSDKGEESSSSSHPSAESDGQGEGEGEGVGGAPETRANGKAPRLMLTLAMSSSEGSLSDLQQSDAHDSDSAPYRGDTSDMPLRHDSILDTARTYRMLAEPEEADAESEDDTSSSSPSGSRLADSPGQQSFRSPSYSHMRALSIAKMSRSLSRGASINDLIMLGCPELAGSGHNKLKKLSSTMMSSVISHLEEQEKHATRRTSPLEIVQCERYVIENGGPSGVERTPSLASIGNAGGELMLAHPHYYYRNLFLERPHMCFIRRNNAHSISLAVVTANTSHDLRVLLRSTEGDQLLNLARPAERKLTPKEVGRALQKMLGPTPFQLLEGFESEVLALEEKLTVVHHKMGVLYAKEGQFTENEFYSNEHGSDEFEHFLGVLGDKVPLRGWTHFSGGLDTELDRMGTHSIFKQNQHGQTMFHVSTYLPFNAGQEQQIERKCHLGNDIVLIIFADGVFTFDPEEIASQFNCGFILIQPLSPTERPFDTTERMYRMYCCSRTEMGVVSPCLPNPPLFTATELGPFIVEKAVNMEQAAWRKISSFSNAIKRARGLYLEELLELASSSGRKKKGSFWSRRRKKQRV